MTAQRLPHDKLTVLYLLARLRSPVSADLLAHLSGFSTNQIEAILSELRRFLRVDHTRDTTRYSLFQRTFGDFLQSRDVPQAADTTPTKVNARIADTLFRDLYGDG